MTHPWIWLKPCKNTNCIAISGEVQVMHTLSFQLQIYTEFIPLSQYHFHTRGYRMSVPFNNRSIIEWTAIHIKPLCTWLIYAFRRHLDKTQALSLWNCYTQYKNASSRSLISKVSNNICFVSRSISTLLLESKISSTYNIVNLVPLILRQMYWFTTFSLKPKDVTTSSNFKYSYLEPYLRP